MRVAARSMAAVAVGVACLLAVAGTVSAGGDYGRNTLCAAAETGNTALVSDILENGMSTCGGTNAAPAPCAIDDLDGHGINALQWSAMRGYGASVEVLLAKGAAVDVQAASGATAAVFAAAEGQVDIVSALLEAGAAVNFAGTKSARTMLHLASERGQAGIVSMLVIAGAAVDSVSDGGVTPLMLAASGGHAATITALAAAGAGVNTACLRSGMTALHYAASSCQPGSVAALLEAGASKTHVDFGGYTPLTLATHEGCTAVADLLA